MGITSVRSYIKPELKDEHRRMRLQFILNKVGNNGLFKSESNTVHVDEKWFYLQKVRRTVRILPEEEVPNADTTEHKSHIGTVMFLSAIGVPQERPDGTWFDGKLGI